MTTLFNKLFGKYLGIEFQEDSIVITYLKNAFSGMTLLSSSTFPVKYSENVSDEVSEYISRHGIDVNKVFVSLPDKWAITKFIDVPSMRGKGKGALANFMKFEIERHIPFNIEEVVYDFKAIDRKDKRSSVVFVAVQKEKIDLIKDYLAKLSIQPHAVTISSYAVLNSIELSNGSVGGWRDIIGIVRRSDVLGKKDETNISIYINKTQASVVITRDGFCTYMRSFTFDIYRTPEVILPEILQYLAEIQSSLSLESFNKLLLSGESSSIEALRDELDKQIKLNVITVNQVKIISGRLKGAELNSLSPSIGACFTGLGIGTYSINLMPHKKDYANRRIAPLTAKIFLILIFILLAGIFTTDAVKQKKYLGKIEETLKTNEPEVKALEKMLSDIKLLKEQSDLLYDYKKNEITLEILTELAGIMPKDTWVTNLNYKGTDVNDKKKTGGELIINGFADSSSNLIPLLENSPFFEKVEFVGPIQKTKDKEQFKLSAKIVRPSSQESETK